MQSALRYLFVLALGLYIGFALGQPRQYTELRTTVDHPDEPDVLTSANFVPGSALCLTEKEASEKLGLDAWEWNSMSIFDGVLITTVSRSEEYKDSETASSIRLDTYCVQRALTPDVPRRVRFVDGKFVTAD